MYAEINAAIQSAKTAFDLIKATKELSNSTEVLTAVNDVQMKLSSAIAAALASQEKQALLADRVQELETKLRNAEDLDTQMQRYQLVEFPDTKALAYKLKPAMALPNDEPMHYLCIACAEKKKKTTMQPNHIYLNCPESKDHMIQTQMPPPRPQRSSTNWKTS